MFSIVNRIYDFWKIPGFWRTNMVGASMRILGASMRKRLGSSMRMLGASMRMLGACLWSGWVHLCGCWVHIYGTVGCIVCGCWVHLCWCWVHLWGVGSFPKPPSGPRPRLSGLTFPPTTKAIAWPTSIFPTKSAWSTRTHVLEPVSNRQCNRQFN